MILSALLVAATIAAADATATAMPAAHMASPGLPTTEPRLVGMSADRLETIDRLVQRGITAGGYPGAAVVVGRKGYSVWQRGFGNLDWNGKIAVSPNESIYDLASLTKVVATTTAIMLLYDRGLVRLDDPVSKYLPAFTGGLKDQVTVQQLLTHHAGLPAGRELWRIARTPAAARDAVLATPLSCKPGACYVYSDLGADILAFLAEKVSGQPLDSFLRENVFAPLGMTDTRFTPEPWYAMRTAPTEIAPPRGYPLRGEVHDENAYALGGVAGHAGLFSTASDLAVFAQMMLNGGTINEVRILADSTVATFTRRTAGRRALGWDTCESDSGGCGKYLSERAYGHTGFTGTSLWIDPDRQMFVVLLTNRVHAARAKRPSKVIADVRNDLADAAALAVTDSPDGIPDMPAKFRADVAADWNKPLVSTRASTAAARKRAAAAAAAKKAAAKKPAAKPAAKKPVAKPVAKPPAKASAAASKKP